jgi:hypothetical protein
MRDYLKSFEAHGIRFAAQNGDQAIGNCPFSDREDKFYVNMKTGLWDSKTAGLSGNLQTFLEEISNLYRSQFGKGELRQLSEDRKLPTEAFKDFEIGWSGKKFSLPIRNGKGRVQDVRMFSPGGKTLSTAGCKTGLLMAQKLASLPPSNDPVYVCEGEWDTIALSWLLHKLSEPGLAVGVPGAGSFKEDWCEWFRGRMVVSCYDHDEAGRAGEELLTNRLRYVARSISYVHWPEEVEAGFDLRDWISYGAVIKKTAKKCFEELKGLIKDKPRFLGSAPATAGTSERKSEWTKPATLTNVIETFKTWLHLENTYAVEMMLAVALSCRIEGDPLWMFLVAPPGGAKTETLTSLALCPDVYMTSSLSPKSLISGSTMRNGADPSLIPKLNGKMLVIKDFTSILSMRDLDKDEIFGILRDAYDGRCGKEFGNGISRMYESRFTILAGVTPKIYELSQQHHALGERFLKICVGDNLVHHEEEQVIRRSIDNINQEIQMRWELQDVVQSFLSRAIHSGQLPKVPSAIVRRIIALAKFGARLRGTVSRDIYRNEIMTSRPSAEVGSRLGKQLAKLGQSLAILHDRKEVNDHDYSVLKKVVLDTAPQRTEDVVRCMLNEAPTSDDSVPTRDLAKKTRYPLATVQRVLTDLNLLDIVDRAGNATNHEWTLSDYIRQCIHDAELYETKEEKERVGPRVFVRLMKKARAWKRA